MLTSVVPADMRASEGAGAGIVQDVLDLGVGLNSSG